MCNLKSFLKNSVSAMLVIILLVACGPSDNKAPDTVTTSLSPTVQATQQNTFVPSLLAEWEIGDVHDMAWSPDSRMFAVNYWVDGDDSNSFVQTFDVQSLNEIWIAENSLAMDLIFTPDGQFIVESNMFAPFFYWRNIERGEVVRQGEFTDISQIKNEEDCNKGGQILIPNTRENTALIVNYNNLLGPSWRTNHIVAISQLDFETGKCKNLFDYQGTFDLFDLNSSGALLAYGGEGKDNSVVIWDMKKQAEVCRTPQVGFGRFVPGESTLAVVRKQKIVFIDASTCKELRELNVSPSVDYENYLAFSPDGKQFAIARDAIEIMNVSTGETLAQIPFPESAVPISSKLFLSGIKFSPDGLYLLVAYYLLDSTDHGEVQLWQLKP